MMEVNLFLIHTADDHHALRSTTLDLDHVNLSFPSCDGRLAGGSLLNLNRHPWDSLVAGSARCVLPLIQ
jgi:hypothetical protein